MARPPVPPPPTKKERRRLEKQQQQQPDERPEYQPHVITEETAERYRRFEENRLNNYGKKGN